MSNRENILTPVGRLVQGSLYEPQTKDAEGNLLVIKNGPQAGEPKVNYFFALAIPKGNEKHWIETPWGKKIYEVGIAGFPNGQTQSPTFAWKIKDGDSMIPNRTGKKPCDQEGFPGHWVLNFSSSFAPTIVNETGSEYILEKDYVNLGDYIQVAGSVSDNASVQQPGVFLNHSHVAFVRYGKPISIGIDPKNLGFGVNTIIPPGASPTPLTLNAPILPIPQNVMPPVLPVAPPALPIVAPEPYPQILIPPPAASAPAKVMLPAAEGIPYEKFIANGWTDQLLIQHGKMSA